jgi:hypothetical protein
MIRGRVRSHPTTHLMSPILALWGSVPVPSATALAMSASTTTFFIALNHPSRPHRHPLVPEQPGLGPLVARDQPADGGHHAPPRKALDPGQDVAHRSGGAGEPGLLGDLAVRDDIAGREAAEGVHHPVFEGRHDRQDRGLVVQALWV